MAAKVEPLSFHDLREHDPVSTFDNPAYAQDNDDGEAIIQAISDISAVADTPTDPQPPSQVTTDATSGDPAHDDDVNEVIAKYDSWLSEEVYEVTDQERHMVAKDTTGEVKSEEVVKEDDAYTMPCDAIPKEDATIEIPPDLPTKTDDSHILVDNEVDDSTTKVEVIEAKFPEKTNYFNKDGEMMLQNHNYPTGDTKIAVLMEYEISEKGDKEAEAMADEDEHFGKPYAGMGREELLRHSTKPFWRTMRMVCVLIVLAAWLALVIAVIVLIVIHPRCKVAPTIGWWQKTVMYRVFVRSFQDSDGDGIGDIKGITSRLDYLEEIGVGAILISPIYEYSDNSDNSILNHTAIAAEYGTIDDFNELVNQTHERGMFLIVDFIPNHTSDRHPWFTESRTSRNNAKRSYYVWTDVGSTVQQPNNWRSYDSGAAWTWSTDRQEHYLHQVHDSYPDLNHRSSQVQEELEDILMYWLDLGVDGFHVSDAGFLAEDYDLRDDPALSITERNTNDTASYGYYDHVYTYGLPEVKDMLSRWQTIMATYESEPGSEKFFSATLLSSPASIKHYYGQSCESGVDFPINTLMGSIGPDCDAECVKTHVLDPWMDNLPDGQTANWNFGQEGFARMINRTGSDMTRALTMLTLTLPGTSLVYYGDEIGLHDSDITQSGDTHVMQQPGRAPMQWDNSTSAGFTGNCSGSCALWMPVNAGFEGNNVQAQNDSIYSMLTLFKNLTKLRSEDTFHYGRFEYIITDKSILSFIREFDGKWNYLVALNLGSESATRDYSDHDLVIGSATVVVTTGNNVTYAVGDDISTDDITLQAMQGIVVSWPYQIKTYT